MSAGGTGYAGQVYIGTILLEPNRWAKPEKTPTFRVSDWIERFAGAGFDGMELWQYHATRAGSGEVEKLAAAGMPVSVFNMYPRFTDGESGELDACTAALAALGARGVKFNVGPEPRRRGEYLANLRRWKDRVPAGTRLLCECHPGTIIEEPAAARRFFDELGDGWEVIVHPFSRPESLAEWLELFDGEVAHSHLQMRDQANEMVRFDRRPEVAREAVEGMKAAGYAGSWTLEFAEGTGRPGEDPEMLWESALADLAFLRELLA